MLRALEMHPPDFVVLVNRSERPMRERPIDTWIRANYGEAWTEGPTYFRDGGSPLTLTLMRRNPS